MFFPDPNIGHHFDYDSYLTEEAIVVTFLNGRVKIPFKFKNIISAKSERYLGGSISWTVVRWGKCPTGTEALRVKMKKGFFRNNFIVFSDLEKVLYKLKAIGIS
jgi:hypothetical protein